MESEAVSSIKIAINLMIISALVFIIIVLVNTVKPNVFDAIASVVNITDEERERQFIDYDRKWVSGTKVLRALKVYESTAFGIVYQTIDGKAGGYALNFGGIFQGADTYSRGGYQITNLFTWAAMNPINDTITAKVFLRDASGNVIRYENKAFTRHSSGDQEYIRPDGRFYAVLIKDVTGETVGICFTQE